MGETDNRDTALQTAVDPIKETEQNNGEETAAVIEADQGAHSEAGDRKAAGSSPKKSGKSQKSQKQLQRPPLKELEGELQRERHKIRYRRVLRSTVFTLVTVANLNLLNAKFLHGTTGRFLDAYARAPLWDLGLNFNHGTGHGIGYILNVHEGPQNIRYQYGPGMNGELLNEPYVYEKALGECTIELPYQVPENRIFVLGDHRSVSVDSRSASVGCVAEDQIVGELVFCVWPFSNLGVVR